MNHSASAAQKKGVRKTIFFLVLAIAVFLGLLLNKVLRPQPVSDAQLYTLGVKVFDTPRIFEQPALLDQTGQPFDYASLKGKWSLLFFGFTYCPDICPATMAQLRNMYQQLDAPLQHNTQIILVSVDPARDTPAKLKEYLDYFSEDFRGLTGEFLKLKKFASQLNAAFQKVPGGGENYQVDHSAQIMLINPKGDYHGFIKPPFEPDQLKQAYLAVRNNFEIRYSD